jgi:hypothetical protein
MHNIAYHHNLFSFALSGHHHNLSRPILPWQQRQRRPHRSLRRLPSFRKAPPYEFLGDVLTRVAVLEGKDEAEAVLRVLEDGGGKRLALDQLVEGADGREAPRVAAARGLQISQFALDCLKSFFLVFLCRRGKES